MKQVSLSKRAEATPPSPIRMLTPYALEAQERGTKVFKLNIGQTDINSPDEFLEGMRLFESSVVAYEPSSGHTPLKHAWIDYINRTLSLNLAVENILVTSGASEAILFTFLACCDYGDEIIVFDPSYTNYNGIAAMTGVQLVSVRGHIEEDFALPSKEVIESKLNSKTKAILLCNPNNPTGKVYTEEEQRMLIEICNEKNLFLIADETYRELVYDGLKPLSVLHLAPESERIIVLDSLSKRFSLCGARIGCLLTSNEEFHAAAWRMAAARLSGPTIAQFAAAHMLRTISDDYLANAKVEYEKRRDVLYECIQPLPGVVANKPQGAFYAMAQLPVDNAEKFATYMLTEFSHNSTTVFVAPVAGFYATPGCGLDEMRIAYVLNCEEIVEAIDVLHRGLKQYPGSKL